MKNLILASVLGGLAAFAWGSISWMALPWHNAEHSRFQDESAVAKVLVENAPTSGLYVMGPSDATNRKPLVYAIVVPQGVDFAMSMLASSLGTQVAGSLLMTLLLCSAPSLAYWAKVRMVVLVGLTAGVLCFIPDWTWWSFPPAYVVMGMTDLVIAWFLAGLVIAWFTPTPAKT